MPTCQPNSCDHTTITGIRPIEATPDPIQSTASPVRVPVPGRDTQHGNARAGPRPSAGLGSGALTVYRMRPRTGYLGDDHL